MEQKPPFMQAYYKSVEKQKHAALAIPGRSPIPVLTPLDVA